MFLNILRISTSSVIKLFLIKHDFGVQTLFSIRTTNRKHKYALLISLFRGRQEREQIIKID